MLTKQKGFAHLFLIVVIVIIGIGELLYFSFQKGFIKTTPTQVVSPTPIPDETANWKTYTDPKRRFSIKYPIHLDFNDYENGISLSYGDPTGEDWENSLWFTLTIYKTTLVEYLKDNPCKGKDETEEWSKHLYESCVKGFEEDKQEYTIDNIKGIRSTWNPYEHPLVINLFEYGGFVFDFRHTSDYDTRKGLDLANQILSTFRFLD